jgi:hypothetical protein
VPLRTHDDAHSLTHKSHCKEGERVREMEDEEEGEDRQRTHDARMTQKEKENGPKKEVCFKYK